MKNTKFLIILLTVTAAALCLGIYIGRSYIDGQITVQVEKTQHNEGLIDLNTASTSELSMLPQISPALARKIIEYRDAHNGFESIFELLEVPGISYRTIDLIKDYIILNHKGE